jgi:hypothetical protein
MRIPSTKIARELIKKAVVMNNARFGNTYTDKTSKLDPTRRSVVFMISPSKDYVILATLEKMYRDLGYDSQIKLTKSKFNARYSYIRAVATI